MRKRTIMKRRKEKQMQRRAEEASLWQTAAQLFSYKEIPDTSGNTHVVYSYLPFSENDPVDIRPGDYVSFEALQNHEHLLDDVAPHQFSQMLSALDSLCRAMKELLEIRYPDRVFHIWGLLQMGGTMMVRFWQEWLGEAPYWTDDMEIDERREQMIHYKTGEKARLR